MNQQLYNQFIDAASMMVVAQKFDVAIQKKRDEQDNYRILISNAKKKADLAHKSYGKRTGWGVFFTIFGFVNSFVLLLTSGMIVLSYIATKIGIVTEKDIGTELASGYLLGMLGYYGIFIIGFSIIGIIGCCLISTARRKRKKFKKKAIQVFQDVEAQMKPHMDEIEKEINHLKDRLRQYAEENDHLIRFLPSSYRNPQAIAFMMKAVENLRADNLTDVINLYEQELHYLEQERILSNSAEMQRLYNESMLYAMDSINQNQKRINSNLQFIQAMQFINMLDD